MSSKRTTVGRERILEAAEEIITRRGGADVTMADIARAAGVSRQAVYLHFADRAELLLALVAHVDERRGMPAEAQKIINARDGVAALRAAVGLQARLNPGVWAIVRAFDAVRRHDAAAERSWQDRHAHRLEGARLVVRRLVREGILRRNLNEGAAADLLWNLTSLRTWEDLVLERGWSAGNYRRRMTQLLIDLLVETPRRRRRE
jgi:AcrR family transcriptional regulator